jgi:undecaprenyl-diphosphatase
MREIILGFIQGVTEFLPISSSGHLAIGQHFWPGTESIEQDVVLNILLHFATLLVVLLYYRQEIWEVLRRAVGYALRRPMVDDSDAPDARLMRKMIPLILVGSVPTGLIGVGVKLSEQVESMFSSMLLVSLALLATGTLLYTADRRDPADAELDISYLDALLIGTMQGIAILPGISRSGATISVGIVRGIDRRIAATFSFLLSIPAILGAVALEARDISSLTQTPHVIPYLLGMAVAFVSGYAAIAALIRLVVRRKLRWFSYYCWLVGGLLLVYSLAA